MHPDPDTKSKSLLAITELTLVAAVRPGLIPAQDTRSYASRAALVLKALNTLRLSSKEVDPTPLIADLVDEIRGIHSFRLTLLNPLQRPQVLLSVTFDGGWEPYMRQIWRDLGTLLDLIFCNCDDYPLSTDCSYDEYITWVRSRQVSTDFFHTAGPMTVNDLHYLRRRERERIESMLPPTPTPGPTPTPVATPATLPMPVTELFAQAIPGIAALYRLSDMFPPDIKTEGEVLLRAAGKLLGKDVMQALTMFNGRTPAEAAAIRWLTPEPAPTSASSQALALPVFNPAAVQGGILEAYDGITHGCLLLLELGSAKAVIDFIDFIRPRLCSAANQTKPAGSVFCNVAFTLAGLHQAGVPAALLRQLPQEFRDGMANRAGTLGDWRHNHPTRWTLPSRWVQAGGKALDRVELSSVHALLQLQVSSPKDADWCDLLTDTRHPLSPALRGLATGLDAIGVRVLSVQATQRLSSPSDAFARGHFGFADGISQPSLNAGPPGQVYSDKVPIGDLLLGFPSSLDGTRPPTLLGPLWTHSNFLVVRKLRQDVPAFQAGVAKGGTNPTLVKAHLMGRDVNGCSPMSTTVDNNFDYQGDNSGAMCPFQSHVRRANPRTPPGARSDQIQVPRILRRGMSYGPAYDGNNGDAERGLLFMAYNASIAEQFEVIQGWLAGGNSASRESWSAQRDPFLAVPLDDEPRDVVFGSTRVQLDPQRPWVRLEWGLYLFVPSLPALDELRRHAERANATDADAEQRRKDRQDATIAAYAARGAALIAMLQQVEQTQGAEAARTQWKLALEDLGARSSGASQAIWTAIRQLRDGVLRTPYGVLVADRQRVMETFAREAPDLTANGYLGRMENSFGPIYLGLDKDFNYEGLSKDTNKAIMDVTCDDAFGQAQSLTLAALQSWIPAQGELNLELKDLVDQVLAEISRYYFGLPDDTFVHAGGWHWEETHARCPGHFSTPSRYMFQPRPGDRVKEVGERHGQLLRRQARNFVEAARKAPIKAPIGAAILAAFPSDDDLAARTLVGAMMGFLPTVDGNLRGLLYEWVLDRRLWDLQSRLIKMVGSNLTAKRTEAEAVLADELVQTMQLRPVPELTWRKATGRHNLGNVEVQPGETVVIGIVSATQQSLLREEKGPDALYPVFGGNRRTANAPTHACPGYDMAMGVLYGVLAGLMLGARLQPTLSPLVLKISARA